MFKKILLFFIVNFAANIFAQTIWTGAGANTNWNTAANWSTNTIPTAADDVIIPGGFIVNLNVSASVKSITVQGNATFNISQNLSFSQNSLFASGATVNWSSGSLAGNGILTNWGTINLTTSASHLIVGSTALHNYGLFAWSGSGTLYLYNTAVFNNIGVFDLQSDSVFSYSATGHSFTNSGTIKKSAGAGISRFEVFFHNTGEISIESGTLSLNGATKTLDGGVYHVTSGSALSLDVLTNISGILTGNIEGDLRWNSNVSVSSAATFNFTGSTQVQWYSGHLLGGGTLTNSSTINLKTAGSRIISAGTTLQNTGLLTISDGGYLYLYDTSKINNTATGTIDIRSDAVISFSASGHEFINAGILRKSISGGNAAIDCTLTNTGTIEVQSGTLAMRSLPKNFNGGIYNVSAGNQLILNSQINVSDTLTGVLDGVLSWLSTVSVATAATFDFSGDAGVNWSSGHLNGGGTLNNKSELHLTTSGSKIISGGTTLKNSGVITMPSGGYFYLYDTSVLDNLSDGILDINSDVTLSFSGSGHQFINNGILKKTTTPGDAIIALNFTNSNTVIVESGSLIFSGNAKTFIGGEYNVHSGSQLNLTAVINVSGDLTGVLDGALIWTGNISVADNARFLFTGASGIHWNSGRLLGGGTLANLSRITLNTNGYRYIQGTTTTLANEAMMIMPSGGYLYLYDDSTLHNKSTGVIDLQSDFQISFSGSGNFKITNDGILKKTAGAGTSSINAPITNSGTIDASSGTLAIADTQIFNNTASGTVTGGAIIDLPSSANFTNNGRFAPGSSPGILTVLGNYKSSATSNLQIDLNGLTQGTEYDLLNIAGTNVVFNGNIDVVLGFDAEVGDEFTIAKTSGTIATANLTIENVDYNGFRYAFGVTYPGNNSVLLTITNKLDIQPPTVVTRNITIPLDATGNAIIDPMQIDDGSTDNLTAPENLIFSLDKSAFTCADLGTNTVLLTVADEAGNSASAPATVTVVDLLAPVISCPADFTVISNGPFTLPDYFANNTVTATDNCSIVTTSQTPVAGTVLSNGNHTISFMAVDNSGNSQQCSFLLTVQDSTLGTTDSADSGKMLLYPNPVEDVLTLKYTGKEKLISVAIFDVSGKLLHQIDFSDRIQTTEISFGDYLPGTYLLQIKSLNETTVKRIIKK